MEKQDFDKILRNVENYEFDWETGKVTSKLHPEVAPSEEMTRVVRVSKVLYDACRVKFSDSKEVIDQYARSAFEAMLPFFNDLQTLIRESAAHSNGIHANDLESVIKQYDSGYKYFYTVSDKLLTRRNYFKIFMEHALDRELQNVNLDFSQSGRASYVSRVGVEFN